MTASRYPEALPPEFEKFGFSYRQIHRTKTAAVYEVKLGPEGSPAYEVVKPAISKQRNVDGTWTPCSPYECYPSSEMWGSKGWTFIDREEAIAACEIL